MRVHDRQDLAQTALRAIDAGATVVRQSTVKWGVAGNCQKPVSIELTGRPRTWGKKLVWKHTAGQYPVTDPRFWKTARAEPKSQVVSGGKNAPLWMDIEARCRKCPRCLAARARLWRDRAKSELRVACRTWFGTLTLSPEAHYIMMCRASLRLQKSVVDWSTLTPEEQFAERHKEISKEITLWLKRVRKNSGASLRILCVAEKHVSGLPHYHVLVHEGHVPVTKRVLQKAWPHGFTQMKLVNVDAASFDKVAHYVSKYLTKSIEARVRASVGYGSHGLQTIGPAV